MIAEDLWNWFFPKKLLMPECVMQLLKFIYPTVDWSRVTFHEGWPHLLKGSDKDGITLPDTFSLNGISIYLKPDKSNPCDSKGGLCDGLGLIVHEGFHVLQMQDVYDGWGLGLVRPSTILYLACGFDNVLSNLSFDNLDDIGSLFYDCHPLENAAYRVAGHSGPDARCGLPASLFNVCCGNLVHPLPCDCSVTPPSLDVAGLANFENMCANVVQQSSGLDSFWTHLAECTPGLEELKDAAAWIVGKTCSWGGSDRPLLQVPLRAMTCLLGLILAGAIWGIIATYFVSWLTFLVAVAVFLWGLKILVEVIGFVMSVIVGLAEGVWGFVTDVWDALTSPFSGAKNWIWFTTYDGNAWQIPDVPVTKNGTCRTSEGPSLASYPGVLYTAYKASAGTDIWYTVFEYIAGYGGEHWIYPDKKVAAGSKARTSTGPALAVYNGKLYVAYKASFGTDIRYSVFEDYSWLDEDIKVTKDGHTRTGAGPALAAYIGKLYMAYKASTGSDIWYNVFDGIKWLDQDIKITKNSRTRTSASPALAVYNGKLYMAYKASTGSDIWYNVFDGVNWLDEDIKVTKDGHTRTGAGPALAAYNGKLYMAYKASTGSDIWYNVFDGNKWLNPDIKITKDGNVKTAKRPALSAFLDKLFLVYRDNT